MRTQFNADANESIPTFSWTIIVWNALYMCKDINRRIIYNKNEKNQ